MPIDIPKFIRAEAQRAELFAELVKRVDRLNSLEQSEAESLALIEKNRKEAQRVLDDASAKESHAGLLVSNAREQADHIVSDAKNKAKAAIDGANDTVRAILGEANDKRDKALTAASLANIKASEMDAKVAAAAETLKALESKIAESKAIIAKAEAVKLAMGG